MRKKVQRLKVYYVVYYKFDMKYVSNRIKNSIVFSEKYNLSA